jgi:hypothetical protein
MGCGVQTGNATCDTCLDTSCCSQGQACANAPNNACLNLFQCIGGCNGNATCQQNCQTTNQAGVASAQALSQCINGSCGTQCGGGGNDGGTTTDGGMTCGLTTGTPACDQCLTTNCCSQEQACVNSTDCMALLMCLNNCAMGDTTCQNTCSSQHQAGVAPYNALGMCYQNSCVGHGC